MPQTRRLPNLLVTIVAAACVVAAFAGEAATGAGVVHKVGAVTRHASKFVDQDVLLSGYLLVREDGYVLFSDEPTGKVSQYDLPVVGDGLDQMLPTKRYVIEGKFLDHGLTASNANLYHLELSGPPRPVQP